MSASVIQRVLAWCLIISGIVFCSAASWAQNTITPKRIEELNTDIEWDNTAFADISGRFRGGNQWAPPVLGSISKALRLGVTMDMYGYFDTTETSHFHNLQAMTADSNFLLWGNPLGNVSDDSSRLFTSYLMGIRFEPSETGGCGRDWTPRDDSAWPLSFTYKYGGSVPSSPSDENYRRYLLSDTDTTTDSPVVVLADPEPARLDRTSWTGDQPLARHWILCMFGAKALTTARWT
jgi:hypothetical protein